MKTDGNDEIRVVIYGCRGSIPVNGRDFDQFGGSTTCILITSDDAAPFFVVAFTTDSIASRLYTVYWRGRQQLS